MAEDVRISVTTSRSVLSRKGVFDRGKEDAGELIARYLGSILNALVSLDCLECDYEKAVAAFRDALMD